MIQAMIVGFVFGVVSNLSAMFLKDKIVQSSESIISKPKQVLILLGFFFLFLTILMGLTYVAVVYADEIRYILIKFFSGFTGDMFYV